MVGLPQLPKAFLQMAASQFTAEQVWFSHSRLRDIWIKWDEKRLPCKWFFQSARVGQLNSVNGRSLESRNWAKSAPTPSSQSDWSVRSNPNQIHFHPREKFSTSCVIGKRSLHVSRLTVSEFSDQGTKGVSVKEGGSVKGRRGGGRREGGMSRKGGRRSTTGEKHFPADQVLIGGSSLGICFKTYLWTHFQ